MDIQSFAESPVGTLVPIRGTDGRTGVEYEHFAFLPEPLPEEVLLSARTQVLVAEASTALGRLDTASVQVPNPSLLRRPAIKREAQSTSALEGTYVPFEDVLGADENPSTPRDGNIKEVLNYVEIAELAFDHIKDNPITTGLLKLLQGRLVEGTPGESSDSGDIRDRQVIIGPEGAPIAESRFVPPPPDDRLRSGVDQWEYWIAEDHPLLPPVVQAALAHYQFETLHPFSDGNGRLGRLLIVLQFCRLGVLQDGLLTVSPWFERRRREYQDHLLEVSRTGDWDPWVAFFATGLRDQARTTSTQILDLLALNAEFKETARDRNWTGFTTTLLDELVGYPVVQVQALADRHGVTFVTANRAVARLQEAGILREITGKSYGRLFVASSVYDVVSR